MKELLLLACMGLSSVAAMAQADTAPAATKTPAFDVVSIKPYHDDGQRGFGIQPTQFYAIGMPLKFVISVAYFAGPLFNSPHDIQSLPSWGSSEFYTITAKLDPATIDAWKDLNPIERQIRFAPLVQKMLEDRFQLKAHTVPAEMNGFAIVVSKGGPKMKDSVPDEAPPQNGIKLVAGGMMVPIMSRENPVLTYFHVSMDSLAKQMTQTLAVPVVNQTGLTGAYNFQLWRGEMPSNNEPGLPPAYDRVHQWDWETLGLELKPVKIPTVSVVIDHIEKPSEN